MFYRILLKGILLLICSQAIGQAKFSFDVISKNEKYVINDSCIYIFECDSLQIRNKRIGRVINASIKSNIYEYINNESYKMNQFAILV